MVQCLAAVAAFINTAIVITVMLEDIIPINIRFQYWQFPRFAAIVDTYIRFGCEGVSCIFFEMALVKIVNIN